MKTILATILIALSLCLAATAQTRVFIVAAPPSDRTVCSGSFYGFDCGPEFVFTYENAVANMSKSCKRTVITSDAGKADYTLKTSYMNDFNGGLILTLLNRNGDIVYSKKTRHIGSGFKDMCHGYLEKK